MTDENLAAFTVTQQRDEGVASDETIQHGEVRLNEGIRSANLAEGARLCAGGAEERGHAGEDTTSRV